MATLKKRWATTCLGVVLALLAVLSSGFGLIDDRDHTQSGHPVEAPDLIDLPLDEALRELERTGLEAAGLIVGKGPSVVEQTPRPGQLVEPGAGVKITVG